MTTSALPSPPRGGGSSTRDMVLAALFTALVCALGYLPAVPVSVLPVPISAQTLGVMLAGAILGPWRGLAALLLFELLVIVGFPVLSGGRGGLSVFVGPTGGFLAAWPLAALVVGALVQWWWRHLSWTKAFVACLAGGVLVVYAVGIPWLAVAAHLPLAKAALGSIVFVPGDLAKAGLAAVVAVRTKRAYPIITT